ncbi:hypothetical protein I6B53_02140 [Schaalia sp. 19OD2882]|uniref:hypothetical protein n=1 Tax=Schaalia sp. 19OD2882 TaxID=2794089 RepID=UPI001C1ECCB7|nr:hypothetical protein [Schaalia sp. 19OD2882]QWW19936.1 hypothetical protein I6B53_02140 [Schaalia sp. 19OD2882]
MKKNPVPWPVLRRAVLGLAVAALVTAVALWALPGDECRVLVAARPLAAGALTAGAVEVRAVDADSVPADALDSLQSLPQHWDGVAVTQGTVLSESLLRGSPAGRDLQPGWTRLSVVVDPIRMPQVEAGDTVDLWAAPRACDEVACIASLISEDVQIASSSTVDSTTWRESPGVRLELVVRDADTEEVLGQAGTGTLSLVLRSRDAGTPGT